MNTPNHEDIAQRARELWQNQGCPSGRDTEIWLEAERQLAGGSTEAAAPAANSEDKIAKDAAAAATVERQKSEAREPISPRKPAPAKGKPAPPGKPVWDKPHSS